MAKLFKKAIAVEFLVRLVIAIMFLTTAVYIGTSFFRLSTAAQNSYQQLTDIIQTIQPGEIKSTIIEMDEETAVVFFNSTSISVNLEWTGMGSDGIPHVFRRPQACGNVEQGCFCLCRSVLAEQSFDIRYGKNVNYRQCIKEICTIIDSGSISFSGKKIPYLDHHIADSLHLSATSILFAIPSGGMVLTRGLVYDGKKSFEKEYTPIPRLRTVYVQREGNLIKLCVDTQCPTGST